MHQWFICCNPHANSGPSIPHPHRMSVTYAPPGESASDLWLERSNLVGAVLGGVAYGEPLCSLCFWDIRL